MPDSVRGGGHLDGGRAAVQTLYRSKVNNLSTPLLSGQSDTGDWEENDAPDFAITVDSDVLGTVFVDFSLDAGVNFTTFPTGGFQMGPAKPPHSGRKFGRWMRVRYTCGDTGQDRLNLKTVYGHFQPLNAPLGGNIASDADAEIVRSIDPKIDLALGRFGGMAEDGKFGYVDLLDAADTGTDLWAWGSDDVSGAPRKTFPTVAGTLWAVSDDTGDTDITLTVPYLDATGTSQSQDVVLTGLTRVRVTDTGDGLDCNRAFNSGANAARGNLYVVYNNDTGTGAPNDPNDVLAYVPYGYGQTQQVTYRVPLKKQVRIKNVVITISRAAGTSQTAARIHLVARPDGGVWLTKRVWRLPVGGFSNDESGLVFPALTSLRLHVDSVDENDTNIAGEFLYDEVDT